MKKLIKVKLNIYLIFTIFFIIFCSQNAYSQWYEESLYGFTVTHVDDNQHLTNIVNSFEEFVHAGIYPTARIVFDVNSSDPFTPNPEEYEDIVSGIHSTAIIMGQIVDSEAWSHGSWENCVDGGYAFDSESYLDRVTAFQNNDILSNNVELWEIGNEINAPWVNDGEIFETRNIIADANDISKKAGLMTALTLIYYPTIECVDDCNGPNAYDNEEYMMLNWAANLVSEHPSTLNIDYVLVSYYADANAWCDTNPVDWDSIFQALHAIFPNSKLGFGECGYSSETPPSQQEILDLIDEFYGMSGPVTSLPYFERGNFWWTYVDDCIPFENNIYWNGMLSAIGGDASRSVNTIQNKDKIISSNYPNPFNPSTIISYNISKVSNVKIVVYDNLGREVQVLFNGNRSEGNYEAIFNGSNVASGVYYYIISIDGFSETKKMLLVK